MEGRTQDVVAPTSEKICGIDDNSTGLQKRHSGGSESPCRCAEKGEGAYYWRGRGEFLRSGVLNLESADLKGICERFVHHPKEPDTYRILEK